MHVLGWLRRHLQAKVLALIVIILIVGFGVLGVWNIRIQSAALLEQSKEAARGLADAMVKSIESSMLEGRPDIVRVLSRHLHTVKEVEEITIFRTNGVEAFADLATLEQVQRDASLEPEVVAKIRRLEARPTWTMSRPLFQQAVERVETQELFETVDGVPVFTLLRPLQNEPPCQKCHGRDHRVRGVARISTSMAQTTAALRRNRNQQGLVGLLTILGVALTLSATMRHVVLRPIRDLAAAAQRIGRGDFSVRVPVTIEDEIGALAAAVNQMAVHLQRSYIELEQKVADHAAMATENAALYAQVRQHAAVLEARVAARTRELEVANRHKSEFLANVSHELRTPLTAIKGFIDNLLDGLTGEMNPRQLRYLTRIKANTDRLARLINDLLDLTRIEAGRLDLRPTSLLLAPLVTEVVASLRPMAEDKHIQLAVATAAPDATVWADRDKVTQVLMNLLGNALKFTPAHGHITVTIARGGTGWVQVAVADTGPGIATEEAAKIFDQFYQVAHVGPQRPHGTGLGPGDCESFSGDAAREALGRECRRPWEYVPFYLARAAPGPTRRGHARGGARMGLKVLIADDEADLVDVLRDRLEAYGFTVLTAGTGREALEKLATEPVDGIFLDVKMPDLDGLATLDEIRRRDAQTPIIMVTASSHPHAAADALARGANAYVLKPFAWDDLKATIEQLYHITLER